MGLNPGYAILEFYVSLVTYTVLHMIFVISSDFVEAFNIPPLNIGIYVDKLAAIRALLMVVADILEWGITQKWLHDPGAYALLSGNGHRRQGSVLSFFAMWLCRLHYIWILYFSDNRSLIAFINMSVEGFWFGVFQMSFFAVGPEYNAFTSLAIHTMGNFIFFTQVILNKLSKSYPYINCLYRVRVHAWVCLITSTISLGPWVWFCNQYIKGNTTQYNELVEELNAVSVDSTTTITAEIIAKGLVSAVQDGGTKFKDLVEKLNTTGELKSAQDADTLKSKLDNGTVKNAITAMIKAEFDLDVQTSKINVEGNNSENKVTVKINTGQGTAETASLPNVGQNSNITLVFSVQVSTTEGLNQKIANRLKKGAEKAKISNDYNPGKELVKGEFGASDSATVSATTNQVKVDAKENSESKTEKVSVKIIGSSGGTEFNNLVKKLEVEVPKKASNDSLTSENLKEALNAVKNEIQALVSNEFGVTVTKGDITVSTEANKVTVTIKDGTDRTGSATINTGSDITIEVKGDQSKLGSDNNKANAIASAIALALVNDKVNEALKKKNVTISIPSGNGDNHKVTIDVSKASSNAVARRIARRLAKSVSQVNRVKLAESKTIWFGISASMDGKIPDENVWSPFLLFIVGAFAEDFAVPGVLPFAFLDPEKANLINYLTPLFFFTGAFIILLLNDVFSGEQSVLMDVTNKSIKGLDSEFKEWSEGKAPGWHALWSLNLLKYTAFFISMWSIHGTYDSLRCIIQSRWRVLILTMFIVVPRATLEVAGYVGVANFAIAQGETMNFDGFSYIAYHDMLAMFCRFVYGKFAVGYNWTLK